MRVIKNALSSDLINECGIVTRQKLKNRNGWGASTLSWPYEITKGTHGSCLFSYADANLSDKLLYEISKYDIPKCETTMVQHYIWTRGSGIARHNDGPYKFGITIYLNETWDIDYGGIFLFNDDASNEYKVICPEFNKMVINDNATEHMVTPVAFDAPEFRITMQIWGK